MADAEDLKSSRRATQSLGIAVTKSPPGRAGFAPSNAKPATLIPGVIDDFDIFRSAGSMGRVQKTVIQGPAQLGSARAIEFLGFGRGQDDISPSEGARVIAIRASGIGSVQ